MLNVVIIPVHGHLEYVKKCIESVIINTKNLKLVIINDGSDNETSDYINSFKSLHYVTILNNKEAKGFTTACNMGIDYSIKNFDFTCLCLLNSDAEIITPDWFDKVKSYYADKIGIVGVVSNNALCQTIDNVDKYIKDIDNKPILYAYLIHGFCYFISKKLLLKIGHLDNDTFPHYGSEDDYSIKAIRAGFNNLIIGSVFVKHHNCTSYTESVRSEMLKKTVPDLTNRWGKSYVDSLCVHANKTYKYLNK
jgi:GT2 family glycosyltransferase